MDQQKHFSFGWLFFVFFLFLYLADLYKMINQNKTIIKLYIVLTFHKEHNRHKRQLHTFLGNFMSNNLFNFH